MAKKQNKNKIIPVDKYINSKISHNLDYIVRILQISLIDEQKQYNEMYGTRMDVYACCKSIQNFDANFLVYLSEKYKFPVDLFYVDDFKELYNATISKKKS